MRNSDIITPHILTITGKRSTIALIKDYDFGVLTLPNRRASYDVMRLAVEGGLNIVAMIGKFDRTPDAPETEGLGAPNK